MKSVASSSTSNQLVTDDLQAYADGKPAPSPYSSLPIRVLLNPRPDEMSELRTVAVQLQEEKERVVDGLREAIARISFDQYPKNAPPSFQKFWYGQAQQYAEDLAERFGLLADCQSRGTAGQLELRSVRLATAAGLSLAYSHAFLREPIRSSDLGDLRHVITAAPADVFVSHDRPLRNRLKKTPKLGVSLLTLPGLLKRIQERRP